MIYPCTESLLDRAYRIPDELVALDQWVVWTHDKRPWQPDAPTRPARASDPTTWGTFGKALQVFADALGSVRQFAGIGFEFADDDPFVGIDLDDCVVGDTIAPAARDIIDRVGGYAEISPSMKGVKIWTRAKLDTAGTGGKRANPAPGIGAIEVYHRGRFFTTTGWEVDR